MKLEFLGQPFIADARLGPLLEESLADADAFWVLTAWAQLSGLDLLEEGLRKFRERGGKAEAMVGIDGGIATREALERAAELFDVVHVFHDPSGRRRTYHPKLYCVERVGEVIVILGSSNLTEGGLYRNYEANLALRLDQENEADAEVFEAIKAFRESLSSPAMPSRELDEQLLQELVADESLLPSEKERQERERTRRAKADSLAKTIFGSPEIELPSTPTSTRPRRRGRPARPPGRRARRQAGPALSWWKRLTRSDAIRKPETSHQRNYLILGKAGRPIDQKTWFRDTFFAPLEWRNERMRTGNIKEVTDVPFEVLVDDESIGEYELRVDHAPHRIANQNNAPTWLHWSTLLDVIRTEDFTDWYVVLSRLTDGRYQLKLARTEPTIS